MTYAKRGSERPDIGPFSMTSVRSEVVLHQRLRIHLRCVALVAEPAAGGWLVQFLGSPPAAPVFMFLMGASMAFSSRRGVLSGVRRGLWLVFLGYALNLLRSALPMWLAIRAGAVTIEEVAPYTPAFELLTVDILQLAGLAFIACTLLRHYKTQPRTWVYLAAASCLVAPLLWGFEAGWAPLDQLLRLAGCGDGTGVAFALFPWLAYPLVGMAYGAWLGVAKDRPRFFRRGMTAGLILVGVASPVIMMDPVLHIGDYYRSGPAAVMWIVGFVLCWLWLCRLAAEAVKSTAVARLLFDWSANVTRFYFIHWVAVLARLTV